jgi:hypothetical protein
VSFLFSGNFFDSQGKNTLTIDKNEWKASSDNWDCETVGGKLIIREKAGKIHLIMSNPNQGIIEIEKLECRINNKLVIGDKNAISLYDATTKQLKFAIHEVHFSHFGIGASL